MLTICIWEIQITNVLVHTVLWKLSPRFFRYYMHSQMIYVARVISKWQTRYTL